MKKKEVAEKEKLPPEKYWQRLVNIYFEFYKDHFRDNDGFRMSPDWAPHKRGMESKGLKGIITRLRTLAEQKEVDWTENYAVEQLELFLHKAYQNPFYRKGFMCCLLNKYKDEIIISEYNNPIVKKILECFYFINPDYTVDYERDNAAAEIIIGFLKAQYLRTNIAFTESSVLQSVQVIFKFVKGDEFWKEKSLKSISNNLQEFVNKIKARKNGGEKTFGNNSGGSTPTSDSKIRALKKWGLGTNSDNGEGQKNL